MEKTIKRIPLNKPYNKLETFVVKWLNERAKEYDTGINGVIEDLMHGGCASGYVGDLIYYSDTTAFYNKFKSEINDLLKEAVSNCGSSPSDVFGDKWDIEDPLALDLTNQNLLAWFGFEETARNICTHAGIEC